MSETLRKIEKWKLKLLDLGKRNRLLNFKETKRSNIQVVRPCFEEIFETLVTQGHTLEVISKDPYVNALNYDSTENGEVERSAKVDINQIPLKKGQVLTNKTDSEMLKTLAQIRAKAKTALEEQGVSILYVAFGFLEWAEVDSSHLVLKSPIVLVPVQLIQESIVDPYRLSMTDDDIVINPTLLFKLQRDFNINFPDWADDDGINISQYLDRIQTLVSRNGWQVTREVQLSLFSFLKLNMYQDLEKYQGMAAEHPIVKALTGDKSALSLVPEEFVQGYDHDHKFRPIDIFQVVDADSSQQDAIIGAKNGISFVLQGPPGTGKSQTITNIIAECLAEGKKVLFVSEKVAALEVVYKRLKEAGLTDFCLQLHSHKINKRVVLDELGKTLHLTKRQTRDEVIADLEQLLEDREKLIQYEKSLHTVCEPLGKSIYEIHGRLLKYQNAPDIQFRFEGIEKVTQSDIHKFQRLLDQFSRTAEKLGSDYTSSPWYGCTAKSFTLELQHDIMTHFKRFSEILRELNSLAQELTSRLELNSYVTIDQMKRLRLILEVASRSTLPPDFWITTEKIGHLTEKANQYSQTSALYSKTKSELLSRYKDSILETNAEDFTENLRKGLELSLQGLNATSYDDFDKILKRRSWIEQSLKEIETLFTGLEEGAKKLTDLIETRVPLTIQDLKMTLEVSNTLLKDPKPTLSWFDRRQFSVIQQITRDAQNRFEQIKNVEKEIVSCFSQEFLSLDPAPFLFRFNTEYNSIFKLIKPSYHRDRKNILAYKKDPSRKMKDEELLQYLRRMKEINEAKHWVSEHRAQLEEFLGSWYNAEYTEWDLLLSAFESFEQILAQFSPDNIPEKSKNLLFHSGPSMQALKNIHEQLVQLSNSKELFECTVNLLRLSNNPTFQEILHQERFVRDSLNNVFSLYDPIRSQLRAEEPLSFSTILSDFDKIKFLHDAETKMEQESKELQVLYGHYFIGLETDWEKVLTSLAWASEFKKWVIEYDLPEQFVKLICSEPEAISLANQGNERLTKILRQVDEELSFVQNLFAGQDNFVHFSLEFFTKWLETCLSNFTALEEWLDFTRTGNLCRDAGLGDFIESVISTKLPSQKIVGAFFKRFYRLWLDLMYQRQPVIADFRRRSHEEVIDEFKVLDRKQLIIAQARLKEMLSAKLPSSNSVSSALGEIGILRHELNKKKRIMPLRKLFRSIPNLLLTLKPCLMMSPLSVSLFLDPESYKFDVVIFDEASQICPEDAIGAIFRADQVIIAGDSEQLPPTNFFNASTGESEYEEDEESDVEAYESILDEARSILPEKTLRWHYRSKHEHLITFSNAKIYAKKHESLITFPSSIDRLQDNGVEYIYVPNGIYERSGSRSNKVEAEKVASLVFEHFKNFPNRSVGVVTFSEAQQNEVETSIRHLRIRYPQYEKFFDETLDEPFFIKNLENVQGDERDTIIFSIGYAKDQNGVMHMNFGPLSRTGGYRRLNVAITRAKYNVKLVGSIRPTDIDLERTNADGVKMLRSYIEFAINGPDALLNELVEPETVYTESPFEDQVYHFLVDLHAANAAPSEG